MHIIASFTKFILNLYLGSPYSSASCLILLTACLSEVYPVVANLCQMVSRKFMHEQIFVS